MNKFKREQEKNITTLKQYVPVVEKVHGKNHPEFYEVRKIFDEINNKIQIKDYSNLNLDNEFGQLRNVTSNYRIPSDTCETYEVVYNMLSNLDEDYNTCFKE